MTERNPTCVRRAHAGLIRFAIVGGISCGSCSVDAAVVSQPEGVVPDNEEPFNVLNDPNSANFAEGTLPILRVFDFLGTHFNRPASELLGGVFGFAAYLRVNADACALAAEGKMLWHVLSLGQYEGPCL